MSNINRLASEQSANMAKYLGEDPIGERPEAEQCFWSCFEVSAKWCVNLCYGPGLAVYHIGKGIYRVGELTSRTVVATLSILNTLLTGCSSKPVRDIMVKDLTRCKYSAGRAVMIIPQCFFHAMGCAGAFVCPTHGRNLQKFALEMDAESDLHQADSEKNIDVELGKAPLLQEEGA